MDQFDGPRIDLAKDIEVVPRSKRCGCGVSGVSSWGASPVAPRLGILEFVGARVPYHHVAHLHRDGVSCPDGFPKLDKVPWVREFSRVFGPDRVGLRGRVLDALPYGSREAHDAQGRRQDSGWSVHRIVVDADMSGVLHFERVPKDSHHRFRRTGRREARGRGRWQLMEYHYLLERGREATGEPAIGASRITRRSCWPMARKNSARSRWTACCGVEVGGCGRARERSARCHGCGRTGAMIAADGRE